MRFSNRVTFVKEGDSHYDPTTGQYTDGEPVKTVKPCKLSTLGTDRTNAIFGSIDEVVIVARLLYPFHGDFDYALINDQKYYMKRQSDYRKGVFYFGGVET